MKRALFRLFDELEDLLPERHKGSAFGYDFNGNQSVKHLVEALGVPHTEIGRVLVNGHQVDTSYQVQQADLVEVYPARCEQELHETATGDESNFRFILDNHLGKLAAYLRMLGFDARYRNDYQDNLLAEIAEQEACILLTRDRRLLMRKQVRSGYCVRNLEPMEQLKEVVRRFGLRCFARPLRRCIRCNFLLEKASKERVLDRLEPLTRLYYDEFRICPNCQQVYWQGSHLIRMQRLIEEILAEPDDTTQVHGP